MSLVDPQGDRTMASDRGVSPGLEAADIDPGWLAGADALHLSGYSLLREPIAGAARHAASLARASGTRVSVDLAAAPLITTYGASRFRGELGELGARRRVRDGERGGGPGRPAPGRDLGAQARPRGLRGAARRPAPGAADRAGAGRRLDRCRRCPRRRLPRRRRRRIRAAERPRGCRALRRDRGRDAS